MRDFIISTDSTAEISQEYIAEKHLMIHPVGYVMEGKDYAYGQELMADQDFYDAMRQGKMPVTGASNPAYITKIMTEEVEQGKDILHLSFAAALSSSYNNACVAANLILEDHPEGKITVIDTTCVTAGQTILVKKAVELKEQGMTMDEVAAWIEENKRRVVHEFIVKDLFHLVRGGRLSKTTAVLGSALKIQPLLHVEDDGSLENIAKIRGRKKAIQALVDNMVAKTEGLTVDHICITHGDDPKEAEELKKLVLTIYPDAKVEVACLCATIGAHTGPGVLVLAYFGKQR